MSIAYDVVTQTGITKVTGQSVLRDLTADDLEGSFTIHVPFGHLVRSLIHVLRDLISYATLELTPTRLTLLRPDKTDRTIVSVDIDTSKFFQFFFLSKKGVIRIGINFSVFWQCVKVIGKQDPFIMSKTDGCEYVILEFGNAAKQQYPLQGICDQPISIPEYISPVPNILITIKELTKSMTYLRTERGRARIKGYKDRIIIETVQGTKVQKLGTSSDDIWKRVGINQSQLIEILKSDPEMICSLHLNQEKTGLIETEYYSRFQKYGAPGAQAIESLLQSHTLLKSLSKAYTIAQNLHVHATIEEGKPIKLVIPIGYYGTLTLYLLQDVKVPQNEKPVKELGETESLTVHEELPIPIPRPVPKRSSARNRSRKPPAHIES